MKPGWIIHISKRYFRTKRKEKGHTSSILSISGIAIGVMTLMTVIAVMNGLQQGQISNINEIRSYHIRIEGQKELKDSIKKEILSVKGIKNVNQFVDIQTIIKGFYIDHQGAMVRAIDEDILLFDDELSKRLAISQGKFDLSGEKSIVIGSDLAHIIGVRPGDNVNLLSLSGKGYDKLSPINLNFTVKGIFKSGFSEINRNMAYISTDSAYLFVPEKDYIWGIKLDNHYRDREVLWRLKQLDSLDGMFIETWRTYNSSLFSALLMEKTMMMVLISLIFVIVAVNIFHSMKRSVVERVEEIALMKAVGATPLSLQGIFIIEGAIIGLLGTIIGSLLGFILSFNINGIFSFVESIVNFILNLSRGKNLSGDFSIYTGNSYFLKLIPIEIMVTDVLYITGIALLSTLTAAWIASRGVSTIKPSEILRYE